ncbi:hypothetical protein EVG20_g3529 [Dentipellis fragilis]|uniref:Uncharacterized protein n=1 Tax=Dentipellis fragilis TaxID=205917 RepID=A0A4Y9Z585_9AGAM|nr:hypothetical protein EVG20_g3529 [Dentipellis fragilis]
MSRTPTKADVTVVAKRAVEILKNARLPCYLLGSMAAMLWGNSRTPNVCVSVIVSQDVIEFHKQDVDIVVLTTTYGAETVKRHIINSDARYHLVPSTNPHNKYKVLWYIDGSISCKVDILIPPTLNLPFLVESRIVLKDDLPICPLLPLLLLKLQGWDNHCSAQWPNLRAKSRIDAADVNELLAAAVRGDTKIADAQWLGPAFVEAGRRRSQSYIASYPASRDAWAALGFTPAHQGLGILRIYEKKVTREDP